MSRAFLLSLALFLCPGQLLGQDTEQLLSRPVLPNGKPANCPLRPEHRKENWTRGGFGCCVVASHWAAAAYLGHPEWAQTLYEETAGEPGGHYPEKLEKLFKRAKAKHPDLRWIQIWGKGDQAWESAKRLNAQGIPFMLTYGYGKGYTGTIAHAVTGVHLDNTYCIIADNNFIDRFSLLPEPEAKRRWKVGGMDWISALIPPKSQSKSYAGVLGVFGVCFLLVYGTGCCLCLRRIS